MSDPTIEEVVSMQFWKHVRRYGQIDATNRLLGAAEALMVVLRELDETTNGRAAFDIAMAIVSLRDRIRAALGEGKGDE